MIRKVYTFLLVFVTSCIFSCGCATRELNDMQEIFHLIENQVTPATWVIFDIDMVLIQPSDPAFQMPNMKRFNTIAKRVMKSIPSDKQMVFLSLITVESPSILIDRHLPGLFQEMARNKVTAMALTSNLTGSFKGIPNMEAWRVETLKKLGINFSAMAPHHGPVVLDDLPTYRGHYSAYMDGILFVNGNAISKGDALLAFFKKIHQQPERVIFIDDRQENIQSVDDALKTLSKPVQYEGIHYTGAALYPSAEVTERVFESQWEKLASEAKELP